MTATQSLRRPAVAARRQRSFRQAMSGRWLLTISLAYLVLLMVWAPLHLPLPADPRNADAGATVLAPSGAHWFGTDQNGYDVFSRIVLAGSNDLSSAAVGTVLAAVLGTALGILFSRGGVVSQIAMRVVDLLQALPLLAIAITVVGLTGGGNTTLLIVIIGVIAPQFIRLVRAEGVLLRKRGFVMMAKSYGASDFRIMWRHLAANSSTVIFPQLSLSLGIAIGMISGLGFLGLSAPGVASWGAMLQGGIPLLLTGQWWVTLFPALVIFTVILAASEASVAVQAIVERPRTGAGA